ncbi:MAG: type IX secretion system sortase PorU [Bacteroidales bacterium]|nr:type IX secretion system sortase PorU [Bacteroidales bacterium]
MMKNSFVITAALLLLASSWGQTPSVLASGQWWDLSVKAEGVYGLTVADIPSLKGADVASIGLYGGDGAMLSMSNAATSIDDLQPLAIDVVDANGNGVFDDGDKVLFYGQGVERWVYTEADARWEFTRHAYANENHYYLTAHAATPLRVVKRAHQGEPTAQVSTHTAVTKIDNDLVNVFASGQRWMGERFNNALLSRNFQMTLDGTPTGVVKLRYALAHVASTFGQYSVTTTGYSNTVGITTSEVYKTVIDAFNGTASQYDVRIEYSPYETAATGYLDFIEMTAEVAMRYDGKQKILRTDPMPDSVVRRSVEGSTQQLRLWDVSSRLVEEPDFDGGWTDSAYRPRTYVLFTVGNTLKPEKIEEVTNQNLHGAGQADLVVVTNPALASEARRLAALHEVFDGMSTLVATDREVFAEFSSGKQDPMALRSLLRWLKAQYPDAPPRYLLLMGKGTYDNRGILGDGSTTLVTYETPYSFDDVGASYCGDDMLGYLRPDGRGSQSEDLDVSVGRLPARNLDEAKHIVDKHVGYITLRDLASEGEHGDWRNYVALLADDADPGHPYDSAFAHSSEVVARSIAEHYPQINVEKLYADAYHQSSGAIGSYYPDLNNALRQRINNGCLLVNYIGHGSATYIGTERYVEFSDIDGYSNVDRLPILVTSTCSYGRFDQPTELCGAEAMLLAPAAAVAVISASRPISHNEKFNNDVVRLALDPENTIGDALRMAKNLTVVSQCIGLTGDPALRLSQPRNKVVVTAINGRDVTDGECDTAVVLSRVTVSGEVRDESGVLISDFDGTIYPIVYDRAMLTSTLANDNPGTEVRFTQQKNMLYRGSHPVKGGRFEYSFVVPKDVAYQYANAKLSHYAQSGADHASGSYSNLLLGGLNDTATMSSSAPVIRLFMGDTNFRSGGLTNSTPTLIALLADSAGINAGAGLGHDITVVLDGKPGCLVVLNDLFQPDVERNGYGTVVYTFPQLEPGRHTLTLKAWNIYNISAKATLDFTVASTDTMVMQNLVCAPNPATTETSISFELNDGSAVSAEVQIYNMHGRLLQTFAPAVTPGCFVVGPIRWDVSSLPSGLYMVRCVVTDREGGRHFVSAKCVVR